MQDVDINCIGVMSGTSLDGVDIVSCTFKLTGGVWSYVSNAGEVYPYPTEMIKMKTYGSSEQVFTEHLFSSSAGLKAYDGYLYFQSSVKDKPVRIKISDGKAQVLELKEPKQVLDKEGYPVESGSPEVKWTDLDSSEKL